MDALTGEAGIRPRAERRARRTTGEIRSLILQAALAEFAARGFAGATTRDIAARARVAEPLIFNNFGSKTTLFAEAVIEPFNERFSAFLAHSETLPPDRQQRSAHFVHSLYPFLRDHADMLLALVKSSGELDTAGLHGLDDYFTRAVERMRSQYEKAGWQLDVPPELLVRYSFGMLAGAVLFRDWFFPDQVPDEAQAEGALARMLFKAAEPRQP